MKLSVPLRDHLYPSVVSPTLRTQFIFVYKSSVTFSSFSERSVSLVVCVSTPSPFHVSCRSMDPHQVTSKPLSHSLREKLLWSYLLSYRPTFLVHKSKPTLRTPGDPPQRSSVKVVTDIWTHSLFEGIGGKSPETRQEGGPHEVCVRFPWRSASRVCEDGEDLIWSRGPGVLRNKFVGSRTKVPDTSSTSHLSPGLLLQLLPLPLLLQRQGNTKKRERGGNGFEDV